MGAGFYAGSAGLCNGQFAIALLLANGTRCDYTRPILLGEDIGQLVLPV